MLPCCIPTMLFIMMFLYFSFNLHPRIGFQHWLPSYRIPAHMQQHIYFFQFQVKNEDLTTCFFLLLPETMLDVCYIIICMHRFDLSACILRSLNMNLKMQTLYVPKKSVITCVFLIDLTKKSRSSRKSQTNNKI